MRTPIGIDLGTTNSLVARFDGKPEIITSRTGERSTPSVVGLDPAGRILVGSAAKKQLAIHPERTVAEVKRLMGGAAKVSLGDRSYSPQELSAMVLRALKEDAEAFLGHDVSEAVVTVPAYFTDAQRQATKDAGELAGLRVERILNEPTAAALAYGIEDLSKEELVVVYDLGGGTFDVSVLDMFEGVIDVKASAGNNTLGGGDFDRALAAWLRTQFETEHGLDLSGDRRALARLLKAAEKAKCELSGGLVTVVQLDALAMKGAEPRGLEREVTRAQLDALIGDLVRSTLVPIESALRDAGLQKERVAEVVLIGGSSRVPLVRQLVAEYFKKEPRTGINPDEAVALGAAIQAGLKAGAISAQTGIMITDVAPFTLGVQVQSSVGSQAVNGMFSPIIQRNATIPISRTETYATTSDGQEAVTISVFQGESRFTKHNVYLDEYTITGVPKAPAGREKISVTFTYDINGILSVTTKIVSTGKEATLVVEKSARRLSPIERTEAKSRVAADLAPNVPATHVDEDALRQLVGAARTRAIALTGPTRTRLDALLAEAERSLAARDALACARLDLELTDLLFSLE